MEMQDKSDRETLLRIKQGYIDDYTILVHKYTSPIFRYVSSRLFDKMEAEDLVQNVFISFYKAIERFDEKKKILPYLFEIAKNELKMYYRSHKETVTLDDQIGYGQTEETLYQTDKAALLKELNKEQKNIMQMLIDGYSYKDIATKLHKPLNTTRTLIRRIRLSLISKQHEKT